MSLREWVPGFASNLFPHAQVPPAFYAGAVEQFKAFVARFNGDFSHVVDGQLLRRRLAIWVLISPTSGET